MSDYTPRYITKHKGLIKRLCIGNPELAEVLQEMEANIDEMEQALLDCQSFAANNPAGIDEYVKYNDQAPDDAIVWAFSVIYKRATKALRQKGQNDE